MARPTKSFFVETILPKPTSSIDTRAWRKEDVGGKLLDLLGTTRRTEGLYQTSSSASSRRVRGVSAPRSAGGTEQSTSATASGRPHLETA